MARLLRFRRYGHPLVLISVWALLEVAAILWVALVPGGQHYAESGTGSLGQAVFVTALLVLFVVLESRLAWYMAIFFAVGGLLLGVVIAVFEADLSSAGFAVLSGASLWLIWSGNIELYVQTGHRRRLVAD